MLFYYEDMCYLLRKLENLFLKFNRNILYTGEDLKNKSFFTFCIAFSDFIN